MVSQSLPPAGRCRPMCKLLGCRRHATLPTQSTPMLHHIPIKAASLNPGSRSEATGFMGPFKTLSFSRHESDSRIYMPSLALDIQLNLQESPLQLTRLLGTSSRHPSRSGVWPSPSGIQQCGSVQHETHSEVFMHHTSKPNLIAIS